MEKSDQSSNDHPDLPRPANSASVQLGLQGPPGAGSGEQMLSLEALEGVDAPDAPKPLAFIDLDPTDENKAYRQARGEFARILLSQKIIDPMGRQVLFRFGYEKDRFHGIHRDPAVPPKFDGKGRLIDDCHHVCFKQASREHDPYNKLPRETFVLERAKRIPLILEVLTSQATRIHESPEKYDPHRQSYSLWLPGEPKLGQPHGPFGIIVGLSSADPKSVYFITAYDLETQKKLELFRDKGARVYPPRAKKSTNKGKHK
jgi:hypothetical protein